MQANKHKETQEDTHFLTEEKHGAIQANINNEMLGDTGLHTGNI
jgi:hypothetical protein